MSDEKWKKKSYTGDSTAEKAWRAVKDAYSDYKTKSNDNNSFGYSRLRDEEKKEKNGGFGYQRLRDEEKEKKK